MFKLDPNPTFWADVSLPVPGGDPVAVEVQFRHLGAKAFADWIEAGAEKTTTEALAEVVCDWRGIDAPYTRDNLGRLFDQFPASARALIVAYRRELFEARTKN